MLILAFDPATEVATSALVDDGEVLGERASRASTVLEDLDALLRQAGARPADLDALAVGTGPGSFTATHTVPGSKSSSAGATARGPGTKTSPRLASITGSAPGCPAASASSVAMPAAGT